MSNSHDGSDEERFVTWSPDGAEACSDDDGQSAGRPTPPRANSSPISETTIMINAWDSASASEDEKAMLSMSARKLKVASMYNGPHRTACLLLGPPSSGILGVNRNNKMVPDR
jgi:hypothetical protein